MIRAADAAISDEPPPPELSLYWQCSRFGALPEPGGIYDQPAGLLERMSILSNIYNAQKAYSSARDGTAWANNNPDAFAIVAKIQRMRWDDGAE